MDDARASLEPLNLFPLYWRQTAALAVRVPAPPAMSAPLLPIYLASAADERGGGGGGGGGGGDTSDVVNVAVVGAACRRSTARAMPTAIVSTTWVAARRDYGRWRVRLNRW